MKRFILTIALAGFLGAGIASPALACEGGKCKMEHSDKTGKAKKGKKGAQSESCHATTATASTSGTAAAKSCCAKKDAPKAEAAKETKAQR
ncbi:hypothetical protein [Pontibacter roseus]|uniref:hypothetical protein n=1 Tax=Pontibacter roseus TaxID=336989 RepID=UPI00037BA9BC|nr:hypothetical protein [Pontibacter roseus]